MFVIVLFNSYGTCMKASGEMTPYPLFVINLYILWKPRYTNSINPKCDAKENMLRNILI